MNEYMHKCTWTAATNNLTAAHIRKWRRHLNNLFGLFARQGRAGWQGGAKTLKCRTGRRKKRASTLFLGWNGGMKENTSIYLPPPLMCLILQAQLVTTQTLFFCQVQRCPELSPLTLLLSVPDFQDVFSGLSLKTLSSKLLHPRCPSILTQLLSISPSPGNLRDTY